MDEQITRKRGSSMSAIMALAKRSVEQAFSSITKNETFNVKLSNERAYGQYMQTLSNKLDKLISSINNLPKMEIAGTPASINIQTMSEKTIRGLTTELEEIRRLTKLNRPTIPAMQRIQGVVKVENQKEFPTKEVLDALSRVEGAIGAIRFPEMKQQEIRLPEFPDKIEMVGQKDILAALKDLKKAVSDLPKNMPTVEFPDIPNQVEVMNFPVQKTPQPVTNININPLRGEVYCKAVTVTTSRTPLPDQSPLAYRRGIVVYNNGSNTVYIGGANVLATDGMPVPAGTYSPAIDAGPRMILYGITASSSSEVRVMETSNEDVGA